MSGALAAALGGAAGAVAFAGIIIILIRYFLSHNRTIQRSSESNSSDTSVQEEQNVELAMGAGASYVPDSQRTRIFTLEELNVATKNFSNVNLIGYGMFGEVNKGLLEDGMVVAIKRRPSAPSQDFFEEVCYLSSIRHRNLVRLLGYCQENDLQMLVYEYVPNGSVSTHLYGAGQMSNGRLEFKHRLSVAHGAAKGMAHLHSLNPPLVHMNFKTTNVLVDEDFIPKVADAGLRSLLNRINGASPSSRITTDDLFLDPEVKETGRFSLKSDVYSFGIFLVELVSGREAISDQRLIEWAQNYGEASDISAIIDRRMVSNFTSEGIREFLRLITWCLNPLSERRPPMNYVEMELHRIREKELRMTTVMGEGTTTVTLGSQLFRSS
ncbi:serine/threonine-protein kinase isoform X1 [Canna indica]|uniref:non-specific serine/threonine protein kinase n=1 Tax=Canna indica TaxID=4628 RepID=A0AAQ3QCD6_9LILI|nr:serine/threonine-protein kinase isoform X1 [Canna indica]